MASQKRTWHWSQGATRRWSRNLKCCANCGLLGFCGWFCGSFCGLLPLWNTASTLKSLESTTLFLWLLLYLLFQGTVSQQLKGAALFDFTEHVFEVPIRLCNSESDPSLWERDIERPMKPVKCFQKQSWLTVFLGLLRMQYIYIYNYIHIYIYMILLVIFSSVFVTSPHWWHSKSTPETSFRDLHVRLVGLGWEQRLRRIREERREGEEHGHHRPLTLQQPEAEISASQKIHRSLQLISNKPCNHVINVIYSKMVYNSLQIFIIFLKPPTKKERHLLVPRLCSLSVFTSSLFSSTSLGLDTASALPGDIRGQRYDHDTWLHQPHPSYIDWLWLVGVEQTPTICSLFWFIIRVITVENNSWKHQPDPTSIACGIPT